jgi:UDP-GlcNAc:undecaprenyl-phosphate/decaprenyl-phosphate GlcNAc-1-phosphate transferase
VSRPAVDRPFALGVMTGAAVTAAYAAGKAATAGSERWRRRNYRDRDVTLVLGPAVGVGALATLAAAPASTRRGLAGVVVAVALIGGYDDLYGDTHARGLRGHFRALRERRVTTGMVKLAALGATAAYASARRYRAPVDVALGTVLVAGGANLINLFDLRPGRAAKVSLVSAAMLGGGGEPSARAAAAIAAGAALAALPADLREQAMLGDTGAGALGALLGWSAATHSSRTRRVAMAAGVVALTLASEQVSFSALIERRPVLRRLDQLGRQSV